MTPQLSGLLVHQAELIAVIPERTRSRAAKVLNASPPSKAGTSRIVLLIEQLASAAAWPAAPSEMTPSSVMPTMVWKS